MKSSRLTIRVVQIKGRCPVYQIGNQIVLDEGYILNTQESGQICMHSLSSLLPYYMALSKGIDPEQLGLSGPEQGCAYVQCLDPCDITGGGTVIFEIKRELSRKK
jgi:uncharacterized repeat protein (TIGR04076 family)